MQLYLYFSVSFNLCWIKRGTNLCTVLICLTEISTYFRPNGHLKGRNASGWAWNSYSGILIIQVSVWHYARYLSEHEICAHCPNESVMMWTVLPPSPNSFVEVLACSTWKCDCICRYGFKGVIKVKWNHMGGPYANMTDVHIGREQT